MNAQKKNLLNRGSYMRAHVLLYSTSWGKKSVFSNKFNKFNQRTIGPVSLMSAEDMLKSAVIEEKKFKHSPRAGADNQLGPNFDITRKALSLWSFVASLQRLSDFIHIFSWFNKCI